MRVRVSLSSVGCASWIKRSRTGKDGAGSRRARWCRLRLTSRGGTIGACPEDNATGRQCLRLQIERAEELDLPSMIHTPHRDKRRGKTL
jgi:hypothetical protein